MKKFIFDISTSARWSGSPVGIIRVERELARRARTQLNGEVSFSIFDPSQGKFFILKDRYVDRILEGDISVDFEAGKALTSAPGWRRKLRNFALNIPIAYQLVQRARGHRFSLSEVRAMQKAERVAKQKKEVGQSRLSVADAVTNAAELHRDSVVISGGLDWEHKNIRQIYRLRKEFRFKFISIVYDLIPVYLPQYVVPHYVTLLKEYFGELLWTSDGCLCISRATKRDLLRYCEENGADAFPVEVFPLGTDLGGDSEEDEIPSDLVSKKYVLYVSTIEPRKNHRTAYEAWCQGLLTGKLDRDIHRLVFVGRQGWNVSELLYEIETNPLTAGTIKVLSNVRDGELKALYSHCAFTIFPSHYEGFGLPLAESFANGKACVTSGAGALSEIGSAYRIDIDPRDVLGWSEAISALLSDEEKTRHLEARISREYQPDSWDRSAEVFFAELTRMTS